MWRAQCWRRASSRVAGTAQRMRPSSASSCPAPFRAAQGCLNRYFFEAVAFPNELNVSITRISYTNLGTTLKKLYAFKQSHVRCLSRRAEERYIDDEDMSDDVKGATRTCANVDKWKWKLNVLLQNSQDEEIVSKEKSDRRDYEHLEALAKGLGLYSQNYGQVVVFSKLPLPNYRPDLDDKRPVRQVQIPPTIHNVVEELLQEHFNCKKTFSEENVHKRKVQGTGDQLSTSLLQINQNKLSVNQVTDWILHRRSTYLCNKQKSWQESSEGQKMLEFRMSLPAYKKREKLLEAISKEQVLVVSGETGCGKTTQLPQYILEREIEAGRGASCRIICTQPRRICAISVSERVASERGEKLGESVGYQVRLEGARGRETRLLFCTTGILLRRLLVDPNLQGVSHVIVDEIHERGINEDFLLIVLKDLLLLRKDLKLILMSATLNADLFSSYFGGAPMMHIPGFTYPVRSHFLEDILETTGHVLSDQNQLDYYGESKIWKIQKQKQDRKRKNHISCLVENVLAGAGFEGFSDMTQYSLSQWSPDCLGFNLIQAVLCHICMFEMDGAVLVFLTGWEDITALKDQLMCHPLLGDDKRVLILPCYGAMASADQKLIFEHPPSNVRKIVLATNIAETSITINDVVFVVDCGKSKETSYDALNNTPCLLPTWISKASARQRKGRAGRVQPGECYHLYPRVVYDTFEDYQLPELLRMPLDSLCLQIKSLKLGDITGFLAKALEPPESLAVQNSIGLLMTIGVLDDNEELTHLGKHLSVFPLDPRIGKMLIMGSIFGCLDAVLTIAAGLAVKDPFLIPTEKRQIAEEVRTGFGMNDYSDHVALVRAYDGWEKAMNEGTASEYCWNNFLSSSTLSAMCSLRKQFRGLLSESGFLDAKTESYNEYCEDRELLAAVICAGLFPNIASVLKAKSKKQNIFKTVEDGNVLLYQTSVLSKAENISYPWLVFSEKMKKGSVILRDSTGISDSMLLLFGGKVEPGHKPGCLQMHNGLLEFYMLPEVAETILDLKAELDGILQMKLENPSFDIHTECNHLVTAVLKLLHGDQNLGAFCKATPLSKAIPLNMEKKSSKTPKKVGDVSDLKGTLQSWLQKNGFEIPTYFTSMMRNGTFKANVKFMGMEFVGMPASTKRKSEKNAAAEGLSWLNKLSNSKSLEDTPPTRVCGSQIVSKVKKKLLRNENILEKSVPAQTGISDGYSTSTGKLHVGKVEMGKKYSHQSDVKSLLHDRLQNHGFEFPKYTTRMSKDDTFQGKVQFDNIQFIGKIAASKKQALENAATEALLWLDQISPENHGGSRQSRVSRSQISSKHTESSINKDATLIAVASHCKRDSDSELQTGGHISHLNEIFSEVENISDRCTDVPCLSGVLTRRKAASKGEHMRLDKVSTENHGGSPRSRVSRSQISSKHTKSSVNKDATLMTIASHRKRDSDSELQTDGHISHLSEIFSEVENISDRCIDVTCLSGVLTCNKAASKGECMRLDKISTGNDGDSPRSRVSRSQISSVHTESSVNKDATLMAVASRCKIHSDSELQTDGHISHLSEILYEVENISDRCTDVPCLSGVLTRSKAASKGERMRLDKVSTENFGGSPRSRVFRSQISSKHTESSINKDAMPMAVASHCKRDSDSELQTDRHISHLSEIFSEVENISGRCTDVPCLSGVSAHSKAASKGEHMRKKRK